MGKTILTDEDRYHGRETLRLYGPVWAERYVTAITMYRSAANEGQATTASAVCDALRKSLRIIAKTGDAERAEARWAPAEVLITGWGAVLVIETAEYLSREAAR